MAPQFFMYFCLLRTLYDMPLWFLFNTIKDIVHGIFILGLGNAIFHGLIALFVQLENYRTFPEMWRAQTTAFFAVDFWNWGVGLFLLAFVFQPIQRSGWLTLYMLREGTPGHAFTLSMINNTARYENNFHHHPFTSQELFVACGNQSLWEFEGTRSLLTDFGVNGSSFGTLCADVHDRLQEEKLHNVMIGPVLVARIFIFLFQSLLPVCLQRRRRERMGQAISQRARETRDWLLKVARLKKSDPKAHKKTKPAQLSQDASGAAAGASPGVEMTTVNPARAGSGDDKGDDDARLAGRAGNLRRRRRPSTTVRTLRARSKRMTSQERNEIVKRTFTSRLSADDREETYVLPSMRSLGSSSASQDTLDLFEETAQANGLFSARVTENDSDDDVCSGEVVGNSVGKIGHETKERAMMDEQTDTVTVAVHDDEPGKTRRSTLDPSSGVTHAHSLRTMDRPPERMKSLKATLLMQRFARSWVARRRLYQQKLAVKTVDEIVEEIGLDAHEPAMAFFDVIMQFGLLMFFAVLAPWMGIVIFGLNILEARLRGLAMIYGFRPSKPRGGFAGIEPYMQGVEFMQIAGTVGTILLLALATDNLYPVLGNSANPACDLGSRTIQILDKGMLRTVFFFLSYLIKESSGMDEVPLNMSASSASVSALSAAKSFHKQQQQLCFPNCDRTTVNSAGWPPLDAYEDESDGMCITPTRQAMFVFFGIAFSMFIRKLILESIPGYPKYIASASRKVAHESRLASDMLKGQHVSSTLKSMPSIRHLGPTAIRTRLETKSRETLAGVYKLQERRLELHDTAKEVQVAMMVSAGQEDGETCRAPRAAGTDTDAEACEEKSSSKPHAVSRHDIDLK